MDVKSLDELNSYLDIWLSQHYHKASHHGLGGLSPEVAFKSDSKPLKFIDIQVCTEAFLHTEERLVDKIGCISFGGMKYEAGLKLIGRKVEVHYDPSWTDEVEIHHKDFEPFKVKEFIIGENCGAKASLPESMTLLKPESSRLLDGLNRANITNRTRKDVAVIFRKQHVVAENV